MPIVNIKQKWSPTSSEASKTSRSARLGWSVLFDGADVDVDDDDDDDEEQ